MNDFIGNNIKFIVEWGQMVTGGLSLLFLVSMISLVRKSRYYLPRGILKSLAFGVLFILLVFSSLVFARITQIRPNVLPIISQLESLIDAPAPTLEYKRISDDLPSSIAEQKGSILLVNFWATWCAPCLKEIPDLQAIEKKYSDQGVKVIMISDEERGTLVKFAEKRGVNLEIGYTNTFSWANLGNERPATFLVNRDGIITHYFTGGHDFEFFENKLKEVLQ